MKKLILIVVIALFSFFNVYAVDCGYECYMTDGDCTPAKCNNIQGCVSCEVGDCQYDCPCVEEEKGCNNYKEGDFCISDEQCGEGLWCSGHNTVFVYDKACCPVGEKWNSDERGCIENVMDDVSENESREIDSFEEFTMLKENNTSKLIHDSNFSKNNYKPDSDGDGLTDDVDTYPNRWDFYGKLRPGDIVLVGHSGVNALYNSELSLPHQLIAYFAMHDLSHAMLYLGNESIIDAHPENTVLAIGKNKIGGVAIRKIFDFIDNPETINKDDLPNKYGGYSKIVALRVLTDNKTSLNVANDALSYKGWCFNYGFDNSIEDLVPYCKEKTVYCSELIAKLWEKQGFDFWKKIFFWSKPYSRPLDLYKSKYTKIIYEGEIK